MIDVRSAASAARRFLAASSWDQPRYRTIRLAAMGLTGMFLLLLARDLYLVTQWQPNELALAVGGDYRAHMAVAQRVLNGGSYYNLDQFAPYPIRGGDVLYPPVTIYLLVPVSVLPEPIRAIVWWGIPLSLIGWAVVRHRPAWWSWPALALCCWWWRTPSQIIHGNIVMWIGAAVAVGTIYRWPAVLAIVKPSVAPFALIGIRSRAWWLAFAALILLSLPFLAWTLQYPAVIANLQGLSPVYSLPEYPFLGIPVIAMLAARDRVTAARPVDPANDLVLPTGGARTLRSAMVAAREDADD